MKRGVLLACLLAGCTTQSTTTSTPDRGGAVRVVAVDVGQGDCTLVVGTDGTVVLIDGGGLSSGAEVRAAVQRETGGRVDHVVVTHYDADHLAGVADFLLGPDRVDGTPDDGAPEAKLWDYGDDGTCSTQTCDRYRDARMGRGQTIPLGEVISLGVAQLECVAVNGRVADGSVVPPSDENSRSVSFILRHGTFTALLAGDLTGGGEGTADVETPLARHTGPVSLLHVNHHGSKTSSNQGALALWAPRAAIISVGTDNSYCHPAQDVLDRVVEVGARVFATGGGMVNTDSRCTRTTDWPAGSRAGLGDVVVTAYSDGAFYVADELVE
ncbi:MAG: MBL fold metallo-hydrolase [Myxococcota bacterium]